MTTTASSPQRSAEPVQRPKRGRLRTLLPMLLILAGVVVLLYPVVATQYNNVKQHEFAQKYNHDVEALPPAFRQQELDAARDYNTSLIGVPILDPYLLKLADDPGSAQWRRYADQLDESETMARVRVPSVKIDLPVRHGTSDEVIAAGAGHLYGTSLPVGGTSTHSVLTSHTGMADATLFDHLIDVRQGDLMFIDVMGETLAYKVDQIKVILPDQIQDLATVKGHDYLTLFTCTPYAVNSHRLLVRGERVPYTPEVAEQAAADSDVSPIKLESWMWGLMAAGVAGVLVVIIIWVRERRRWATRELAAGEHGMEPRRPRRR